MANKGAAPVQLAPYASVQRQGAPSRPPINVLRRRGRRLDGKPKLRRSFKDLKGKGRATATPPAAGWAHRQILAGRRVLFAPGEKAHAHLPSEHGGDIEVYEANYRGRRAHPRAGRADHDPPASSPGAKKVSMLQDYQKTLDMPRFDHAVDWGQLWFLTRPIFWLLEPCSTGWSATSAWRSCC